MVAWSLLMLWLCLQQGIQHDYRPYVRQWRLVLDGADPWATDNSYGPLHAVLAFLLPYGVLVPKLFIVTALLVANAALFLCLLRERGLAPILIIYLLAIPTNVLTVGIGVFYGLNDGLVAALLVAAVLLRRREHFLLCGVCIGLSALIKYYPLLLLPFFALDGRRLHWPVILGGMAVFFAGMGLALAVWGEKPLKAVFFGASRGPTLMSILKALRNLDVKSDVLTWLNRYNTAVVVIGVAIVFVCARSARRNWLEAAVLGYLVMLTLYKVGHQQFYLPWVFMVAALPLLNTSSGDRMAIILMPAVLLLSLFHFGYAFASNRFYDQLQWARAYAGFIAFPVSVATIAACVIDFRRRRFESPTQR